MPTNEKDGYHDTMGDWYRVVKTIKGHSYIYEQQTYREGGRVRTRNRYIGPAGGDRGTRSSSSGASASPTVTTTRALPNSDAGGEFDDELAPAVVTVQDLMQE